jgi:hypothetical protein
VDLRDVRDSEVAPELTRPPSPSASPTNINEEEEEEPEREATRPNFVRYEIRDRLKKFYYCTM